MTSRCGLGGAAFVDKVTAAIQGRGPEVRLRLHAMAPGGGGTEVAGNGAAGGAASRPTAEASAGHVALPTVLSGPLTSVTLFLKSCLSAPIDHARGLGSYCCAR